MLLLLHRLYGYCLLILCKLHWTRAFLFYPRGGSLGYLAAVAMPLDLPNRNVYVAFNFEANYGLPANSSYFEWVERWDLAQNNVGIGNNVTGIDGRRRYTRQAFYASFVGYADHFKLNGVACLLRTICEVAASNLHEHNGLLGSIFKILFMPSTSAPETITADLLYGQEDKVLHEAELHGRYANCTQYSLECPSSVLDMISKML